MDAEDKSSSSITQIMTHEDGGSIRYSIRALSRPLIEAFNGLAGHDGLKTKDNMDDKRWVSNDVRLLPLMAMMKSVSTVFETMVDFERCEMKKTVQLWIGMGMQKPKQYRNCFQ